MVASGGVLSGGYGHDGPGDCLSEGQTKACLRDIGMTDLGDGHTDARPSHSMVFRDFNLATLITAIAMPSWVVKWCTYRIYFTESYLAEVSFTLHGHYMESHLRATRQHHDEVPVAALKIPNGSFLSMTYF